MWPSLTADKFKSIYMYTRKKCALFAKTQDEGDSTYSIAVHGTYRMYRS
jgi:hypothetical protein